MTNRRRLLLVEDDDDLRGTLAEQLEMLEDFDADQAENGVKALSRARSNHYDLILLDVGLPDIDGREVCRIMRRAGVNVPVIMLSAHSSDAETILGLDAGADDYIAKPLRVGVLLARIRSQFRRFEQASGPALTIGRFTFQPGPRLLVDDGTGERIQLTEKETAILGYLCRARNRAVSKDVLLNELWGYSTKVTTHTLETHIYRLRQKMERDPSNAELLVTGPDGYRLNL